ncbi:hypothetical protein SELMODRAFT_127641 [Selaginella moellendorffii]|uniref:non-specific serine/threonine protein kinase n=1 Tax=Selaginella moellendorffii TaxID=88036 RepID=D8SY83_SELML|nr:probable receptor-like protein kinase At1g11050 [Selaginella moellendorffii]EFJ10656.1 hypothetical protein SELMODRAFT_127641 [Selaginella moellendorffii]|eukprot:XP_002988237.1 probable receptor-like protein kinase At1g11050 [Selaginella moellendorffii]
MRIVTLVAIALLAAGAARGDGDPASCSVDYSYVGAFSSTLDHCRRSPPGKNSSDCCSALLTTFGIGLADYLRRSGGFEFADLPTANACLKSFQAELDSHGTGTDFVRDCPFEPPMFVQSPICAGVMNISDWKRVVAPDLDRALERSCGGDLSSALRCQSCTDDVTRVVLELQGLSNSTSVGQQCVYVSCLYAAGVVNKLGPKEPSTAVCVLGLTPPSAGAPGGSRGTDAKLYIGIGVGGSAIALAGALIACIFLFHRRRKKRELVQSSLVGLSRMPNLGLIKFSFEEIKAGTQNFSSKNFIGEGGYGRVYRGVLAKRGNSEVAVKVMKASSKENNAEFLNEVEVINRVRHRNLLSVRGACVHANGPDSQHILVYDYMPNGCLKTYLSSGTLSWQQRRKIAIGIAVGINYLHNEVEPSIIHRDIKPSNILLDEDLNARVADFGLAKISPEGMSHLTTRVAGTPIYMAVEYALYGQCSDKVDVYSFGVLLLELMSGRSALDTSQENPVHYHIVDWAWSLVKAGRLPEIIDEKIRDSDPAAIVLQQRFVLVGILCAHLLVAVRPPISQALKLLEGNDTIPPIPDRPPPYIFAGHTLVDGEEVNLFSSSSQTSAP